VHALDCLRLGGRHLADREWLVTADALGNLQARPSSDHGGLPAPVQAQFAYHETAGPRRVRRIEADELFLFNLALLEQPAESPGLDDPVYLYGTLFGPFPGTDPAAPGTEGQLTVTRVDLLDGLVRSAEYAFRHPARTAADDLRRCFHLTVPADREEQIRCGRGLVTVYPLMPAELVPEDPANEAIVSRLLYDMLAALREDLVEEAISHPLTGRKLPVPSRHLLEKGLEAEGYEIKGEFAVRVSEAAKSKGGLLGNVLGALTRDRVELPPEGDVDAFLGLAAEAVAALPGSPPGRLVALRTRIREGDPTAPTADWTRAAGFDLSGIAAGPQRVPRSTDNQPPPAWTQEMIAAHARPGGRPPRITSSMGGGLPAGPSGSRPDWMADFDPPDSRRRRQVAVPEHRPPATSGPRPKRTSSSPKPEWMKDFE
jgi:hypothetical protein